MQPGQTATSGCGARAHWCGHRDHTLRGGVAATGTVVAGPGFGLHGELNGDIDGLVGKERRTGSHQRCGVTVRWRQMVLGGAFLHSGCSPAVTDVSVVVLQLEKRRGR
jgi:hypothetical protein